jgi:hypothetical protein
MIARLYHHIMLKMVVRARGATSRSWSQSPHEVGLSPMESQFLSTPGCVTLRPWSPWTQFQFVQAPTTHTCRQDRGSQFPDHTPIRFTSYSIGLMPAAAIRYPNPVEICQLSGLVFGNFLSSSSALASRYHIPLIINQDSRGRHIGWSHGGAIVTIATPSHHVNTNRCRSNF